MLLFLDAAREMAVSAYLNRSQEELVNKLQMYVVSRNGQRVAPRGAPKLLANSFDVSAPSHVH